MDAMKTKLSLHNITLCFVGLLVFSTSSFAATDYVARLRAENPPFIKHKDWMQIEPLVSMADLDAPFVYLCAAIERNAEVNRFRVTWNAGDYNFSDHYAIAYDRRTKILWYRMDSFYSDDSFTFYNNETDRLSGVAPAMILDAKISLNSGKDSVLNSLTKSGCKRTSRKYARRERVEPLK